jgi:hypothetical protein
MALTKPIHRLSEGQYLEIERKAEFKSEFFDGEMFAMAGGSRRHSLIASKGDRASFLIAIFESKLSRAAYIPIPMRR